MSTGGGAGEGGDSDASESTRAVDEIVRVLLEPYREQRIVEGAWRVDPVGAAIPAYIVHTRLSEVERVQGLFYAASRYTDSPITFHVGDRVSVARPMPALPKHARPLWAPAVRLLPRP
jgi:hypothetical protein